MALTCAAVTAPVYVDGDTGFGGVNNVRQMVKAFEKAGVAALFFTDQVFPSRCGYLPGKQVIALDHMLAKLKAALDARSDGALSAGALTVGGDARLRSAGAVTQSGDWAITGATTLSSAGQSVDRPARAS